MIFTFVHAHAWELTGKVTHGARISRCVVCGDEAYGSGTPGHTRPIPVPQNTEEEASSEEP